MRLLCLLFLLLLPCAAAAESTGTPRFVVYYNSDVSPAEDLIGLPYSHVILSFVTLSGGLKLAPDPRLEAPLAAVGRLQADGKKVLISFGGGDMRLEAYRPAVGREAALAAVLAGFVAEHGLDGVDIDFEIDAALQRPPAKGAFDGRAFLVALSRELRKALPEGALITHAPQAPYLDPRWHGGPYLDILRQAGTDIDWIMVQYYNNPDFDLPIASHLVGAEKDPFPVSYAGITGGVLGFAWPAQKTLVGLPIYRDDASNGFQPPEVVRDQIVAPLVSRYGADFGGLGGWQFSTHTADHRYWNERLAPALRP
ncbi:glycoside hydrolase family 18 protein [Pelagibius marinus]|uniref:glycoside hydrolase family 18 protein n=1 Tax=Pelagibius marinus TaxID=2762760 RepID=UPI0018732F27|nr:glycoside hydrolase family 18 protein [Pelagibius marinus]